MRRVQLFGYIGIGLMLLCIFLPLSWINGYDGMLISMFIISALTSIMFVVSEMYSGLVIMSGITIAMTGLCFTIFSVYGQSAVQVGGLLTPIVTALAGSEFVYHAVNRASDSNPIFSYLALGPYFSFAIAFASSLLLAIVGFVGMHSNFESTDAVEEELKEAHEPISVIEKHA